MQRGAHQGQISQVNCVKEGCPQSSRKMQRGTLRGQISKVNCVKRGATKAAENIQRGALRGQISQVDYVKRGDPKAAKGNPAGPDFASKLRQNGVQHKSMLLILRLSITGHGRGVGGTGVAVK